MNSRIEVQTNHCGGCINPSPPQKSPSLLKKLSSLFCCYLPSKKEKLKKNSEKTRPQKIPESPKTEHSIVIENLTVVEPPPQNEVLQIDFSEEKNLSNEINWFSSPIAKSLKCKSGTGSIQAKCPFLKKYYVSAKLGQYTENELFFWKNNDHFVIAKIKCNDFYNDENNNNEKEEDKIKNCAKLSFNSMAPSQKTLDFKEHLNSLDTLKPRYKYSVINLGEETKNENKEYLTYDERLRNSRTKNTNFLKNQNVFEKKIKIDSASWEYTIPDKISSYLAKRCRLHGAETVLDAFCGIGMNAINFYKEDFQVIALDSRIIALTQTKRNHPTVEYAQYNAGLHGINDGINFITGEFLDINFNKMMLDVILINPVLKYNPDKKFSLIRNTWFDYQGVLKKALKMVGNVVLCLPRYVEILEIVELFWTVFNESEEIDANCIEIEFQFINKELQQIVVFYGPVAGIAKKDILDFLLDNVNKDNKTCKMKQNNFIQSIFSRIGIKSAAKYIVSAEIKAVKTETILQRFIDLVKINRELSIEELDDCRKETEVSLKTEIIITKEEKSRDMALREQCLMLKVNEELKEKKKFQTNRTGSNSNMFEMNFENYLDVPRSKILKSQEIADTPTYSYYSGKLMSSTEHNETLLNCVSIKEKEFPLDYSFKRPDIVEISPKKENKMQSVKLNKDLEFWGDTRYEMGFINHLKSKENKEGKFPEYKCKIFDFV